MTTPSDTPSIAEQEKQYPHPRAYRLARNTFTTDFILPEEISEARPSIVYTKEQMIALSESIPTIDVLVTCKENGYAILPAPPAAMSLLDVRGIDPTQFHSNSGGWYSDQAFASVDKTSFGWLLVKKKFVLNSTSKTWDEQLELLGALEHVPNIAEMSWFITTYFMVRGIRLFEGNRYVRTSSIDSNGSRVSVGRYSTRGLNICDWRDSGRDAGIGLAAARK